MSSDATAATGDAAAEQPSALKLLRAQQNAYYIEAVQGALEAEERRKQRLAGVSTHLEAKRLEKQFARERRQDKEWLEHIQEDHSLLLKAKIAEWKANGGVVAAPAVTGRITARSTKPADDKPPVKLTKERLDHLSKPRATAIYEQGMVQVAGRAVFDG